MTSSNGNLFRFTGPMWGESTGHRRSFEVFFDLHLNKRLNKQLKHRRYETPSCSSWRHCNLRTIQLIPCSLNYSSAGPMYMQSASLVIINSVDDVVPNWCTAISRNSADYKVKHVFTSGLRCLSKSLSVTKGRHSGQIERNVVWTHCDIVMPCGVTRVPPFTNMV